MPDYNDYLMQSLSQDPSTANVQPGDLGTYWGGLKQSAKNIFGHIQNLQNEGNLLPSQRSTNVGADIVHGVWPVTMGPGAARAASSANTEVGAFGSGNPEFEQALMDLGFHRDMIATHERNISRMKDIMNSNEPGSDLYKAAANNLEYSQQGLARAQAKEKDFVNEAKNYVGPGFELGSSGGTGWRNLTPAQREAMLSLSNREKISPEDLKEYLTTLGVPHREIIPGKGGTRYIKMEDPNATEAGLTESFRQGVGIPRPTYRFPTDEHMGSPTSVPAEYSLYDTGLGPNNTKRGALAAAQTAKNHPGVYVNEAGQSYAEPEAMRNAMNLRFSRAPNEGNWLTSPDYAPYGKGYPQEPQPPASQPQQPHDPRQLDFFTPSLVAALGAGGAAEASTPPENQKFNYKQQRLRDKLDVQRVIDELNKRDEQRKYVFPPTPPQGYVPQDLFHNAIP